MKSGRELIPRRPAVVPQKWEVVQVDIGTQTNPQTKEKLKFVLFVDEGSQFKVGRVLFVKSRQQATWELVQTCLEEDWISVFGASAVQFEPILKVSGDLKLPMHIAKLAA